MYDLLFPNLISNFSEKMLSYSHFSFWIPTAFANYQPVRSAFLANHKLHKDTFVLAGINFKKPELPRMYTPN